MTAPDGRVSPEATIADVVTRYPATIPVFERLGIDYCCGGKRPLGAAVADKGLDWQAVGSLIEAAVSPVAAQEAPASWSDASLTDLIAHILDRYHARLREDLPRLSAMGEKVINAHGERHPEVRDVAQVYAGLRAELESHMVKEEHILFPFIEQLEAGAGDRHPLLGRASSPIAVMEAEHDSAGAALARLRTLTSDHRVPPDGCATFRGYYDGLAALERDLHAHIHLENNVLFPRALALEARILAGR